MIQDIMFRFNTSRAEAEKIYQCYKENGQLSELLNILKIATGGKIDE